jgi:hypothetical protein
MTGLRIDSHGKARRVAAMTLTPLNIATSLAYDVCAGAHVNSGEVIERDVGPCYICAACGVPIRMTLYRPGMIRLHGSWKEDVA